MTVEIWLIIIWAWDKSPIWTKSKYAKSRPLASNLCKTLLKLWLKWALRRLLCMFKLWVFIPWFIWPCEVPWTASLTGYLHTAVNGSLTCTMCWPSSAHSFYLTRTVTVIVWKLFLDCMWPDSFIPGSNSEFDIAIKKNIKFISFCDDKAFGPFSWLYISFFIKYGHVISPQSSRKILFLLITWLFMTICKGTNHTVWPVAYDS